MYFLISWCRLSADFYEKPLKVRVAYERYNTENPHYTNDYASLRKLTKAQTAFQILSLREVIEGCEPARRADSQLLIFAKKPRLLIVC
jgi:hypothetical protein